MQDDQVQERLAALACRIEDKIGARVVYHVRSEYAPHYLVRTTIESQPMLEFYILPGSAGVGQVERYCTMTLGITVD